MTGQLERRTFVAEVPRDLAPMLDLREESLRLAYIDQSARTRNGVRAPLYPFEVTHKFVPFASEEEYLGNDPR